MTKIYNCEYDGITLIIYTKDEVIYARHVDDIETAEDEVLELQENGKIPFDAIINWLTV